MHDCSTNYTATIQYSTRHHIALDYSRLVTIILYCRHLDSKIHNSTHNVHR